MNIQEKKASEIQVTYRMIALYCKRKHGTRNGLCKECQELEAYSRSRTQNCPFTETKTFCSQCKVHCYSADMREKIREVMQFSGMRLFFSHPVMVTRHVIESRKEMDT
jgi:hypothetical protein